MINKIRKMKKEGGQVALETLVVFVPWFIVTIMFFNLLFVLGSSMLSQATINRGVVQAGSLGCVPSFVQDDLESRTGLGMQNPQISAVALAQERGQSDPIWDRTKVLDENGKIKEDGGEGTILKDCGDESSRFRFDEVESLNYIYLQVSYDQNVILPTGPLDVTKGALFVSNSLKGEGYLD